MLTLSGGIDLLITQLMNERQTKMKCELETLSCQYLHFIRQPRVRRQCDFKRYFGPETENIPYYYSPMIDHKNGMYLKTYDAK